MSDLSPNEFEQLIALEDMLAELSLDARQIADKSGLSRRAIAKRMGHSSTSTVQRLVSGAAYNSTVETLARFAWACGFECRVQLVPRAADDAPEASLSKQDHILWFDAYRSRRPQWSTPHTWQEPAASTDPKGSLVRAFAPAA